MLTVVIYHPSIKIEGFKMIDVFNRTSRINSPAIDFIENHRYFIEKMAFILRGPLWEFECLVNSSDGPKSVLLRENR
jgi:hypothetical protein